MLNRLLAVLSTSVVLAAAPAFADRDRHHRHGGDRYYRESRPMVVYRPVYREVYIEPAPVYREVYVEPRPVYVRRSYQYDRPRYVEHHHHHGCGHDDDAWKWIGGSILVGAILHEAYH